MSDVSQFKINPKAKVKNMRRALSGILIVCVLLSAVGFSDGPLRRLFFPNRSVEVTRKVCTGPNCPKVQSYAITQSSPLVVSQPVVVPRATATITYTAPPARSLPATPIVAQTQITPATPAPLLTYSATQPQSTAERGWKEFRRDRKGFLDAVGEAVKQDIITPREATRLRIASLVPAFLRQAKYVSVIHLQFTGQLPDDIPRLTTGEVDIENVAFDWSQIIPIMRAIFELLVEFGIIGASAV